MNYLAHTYLAAPHAERMCGALIGDFAKGLDLAALPREIAAGVRAHRRVDRFTDDHPIVGRARSRFERPYRRFAGIIVDVAFDHFLARDFARVAQEDLVGFTGGVYRALAKNERFLPERLARIRPYMQEQDWLASYAELENVERALAGISRRMKRENPLATAIAEVDARYDALAGDFAEFFPELQRFEAEALAREAADPPSW